jgi:PadR family transcriptional regulator, regulatory protein AphA
MSRPQQLTATSYVVLGLLCVRPWSAYELVQQIERGWSDVWPRAGRGIYLEPKKLVARDFATVDEQPRGQRTKSVYEATAEGRAAFQAWLGEPPNPPAFESEALIRVLFAEHGSQDQLLATISSVRDHAQERSRALLLQGRQYQADGGPFPERVHILHLVGGYFSEHFAAMIRWADWAEAHVRSWDGVTIADVPDVDALAAHVAQRFQDNLGEPEPPADAPAAGSAQP